MLNVIYVAPYPLETTMLFAHALGALKGVRFLGIFQEGLPPYKAAPFDDLLEVQDVMKQDQLEHAIQKYAQKYGTIHRLLGILEPLQEILAELRDRLEIPGIPLEVSKRFRDKALMKESLNAADLSCARHQVITDPDQATQFAERVGFPLVLKPLAGAGCHATYRINSDEELEHAIQSMKPSTSQPALAEEFLSGAEHSMETLTLEGVPRFYSISRYFPTPLEVNQTPWIQWVVMMPRDLESPTFHAARDLGFGAIKALGLKTGLTHMEWFQRTDGSLAIGEIAARPPGAQIVKMMSYVYDRDLYTMWAELMVNHQCEGPWDRKYAVATAFLRGQGSGRITRIEGLQEAQERMGSLVVEARLPRVGAWKSGHYEGDGWVIIRHPDTEVVKKAALALITTVKIHYSH